jgi:O-antigen/teichoic acid export membrane protein
VGAHREEAVLSVTPPGPRRFAGLLHYFGTGVIDQVLLSGASFVIGLLMIRYTGDEDYGYFVLAQSAILLLLSAQGAWQSGPVTAIAPTKTPEVKRQLISAVRSTQTRVLRWVAPPILVVIVAGYYLHQWSATVTLVSAATTLAGWTALQREYLRNVLLIYSRPHSMLRADIVYVCVVIIGIVAVAIFRQSAGILSILTLMIASWAGAKVAARMLAIDPGWTHADPAPFWRELRPLGTWAAVGAVCYWLFAQSYNYILATRLDLSAVTSVNAARLVLMPVQVFALGINNLLMPVAANWLAEFGLTRMLRRLAVLTLAIVALDFIYFGLAWVFRAWLVGSLLHKVIADRDRLLILWGCVALIFVIREVLQAALFALKQVKSMAWSVGLSAAAALTVMWIGIAWWGAAAVLVGQVVGECVNLIVLTWLLWGQVQATRPSELKIR